MIHFERIEKLIRQKIKRLEVPENLLVKETPFEESQKMAKELDEIKKKENPEYKGAFHEKKKSNTKTPNSKDKKPAYGKKANQKTNKFKGKR